MRGIGEVVFLLGLGWALGFVVGSLITLLWIVPGELSHDEILRQANRINTVR